MFISVIDGITGPIAHAGPAAAPTVAEETAPVPPGGLIEWDGQNTIWYGYSSARMDYKNVFGDSFEDSFWDVIFWEHK